MSRCRHPCSRRDRDHVELRPHERHQLDRHGFVTVFLVIVLLVAIRAITQWTRTSDRPDWRATSSTNGSPAARSRSTTAKIVAAPSTTWRLVPQEATMIPTVPSTMRAAVHDRYGEPEVIRVGQVPVPSIADDEVLLRVSAAGVDRGTWHLLTGQPYLARLAIGLRRPRVPVLGRDVAGTVVATGSAAQRFTSATRCSASQPARSPIRQGQGAEARADARRAFRCRGGGPRDLGHDRSAGDRRRPREAGSACSSSAHPAALAAMPSRSHMAWEHA